MITSNMHQRTMFGGSAQTALQQAELILHVLSSSHLGKDYHCHYHRLHMYAGVLPPCGHACNAVLLVDQGLCPLQDLPDVQLTHQAATNSTPVDTAADPSSLQLPDLHNHMNGLGATEQMGAPAWCPHQQAASRMQCATVHTQTCPKGLSNHMPLSSAHLGTPGTEKAHLSSAAPQCIHTLYCGAGQLDAYLALSFGQLLALSHGRAVDLVQSGASQPSMGGSRQLVHSRPVGTDNTFLLDSMCGRLCRWLRSASLCPRPAVA